MVQQELCVVEKNGYSEIDLGQHIETGAKSLCDEKRGAQYYRPQSEFSGGKPETRFFQVCVSKVLRCCCGS